MVQGIVEQNRERADDDDGHTQIDRPDLKKTPDQLEREASQRLEEIHQYLADRYARRSVVARTVTASGQMLDWVPSESQLRSGVVADPPEEDRPFECHDGEPRAMQTAFELQHERAADGEIVFLEINPAGQWLFIEQRTQQPITKAVAHLLVTGAAENH